MQPLCLASVHLAPASPAIRLAEAEAFALLAGHGPAIAGGDWNALPAADPSPPETTGIYQRKLDRRAAIAVEEAGFLDVGAHLKDTTPTVGHFGSGGPAYRCDRIYTTLPPETITSHEVITAVDADSDHRPVIATFDLARSPDAAAPFLRCREREASPP